MIDIPRDIAEYLVGDEVINRQFTLKDRNVFASTSRLFIKKGHTVRDIGYAQISSIESQARRKWLIVIIGILLIAYSYSIQTDLYDLLVMFPRGPEQRLIDSGFGWLVAIIWDRGGIIGFFFLVFGFFRKTQRIQISVVGISRRQELSGDKDTLDALCRLVDERRPQTKPIQKVS